MNKSLLFIINPKSGRKRKIDVANLINQYLDKSRFSVEIQHTTYAKEATVLAKSGAAKFDIIVAVGGDGTVNEVIRGLENTNAILGIIPMGSGNGLARHLGISVDPVEALKQLNSFEKSTFIDTVSVNDHLFANVAGVGFDAHVAKIFASSKKRGFLTYLKVVLKEFFSYKPHKIRLLIEGEEVIEEDVILISFANSSQFGNNTFIAPLANISDGLVDICILRKMPFWYTPFFIYRLFSGTLSNSKYFTCSPVKYAEVFPINSPASLHIDGDPTEDAEAFNVQVNPSSLKVISQCNNPLKNY